jgi:short-subunit dehydrogenase
MNAHRPVCLITGASSGIGEALAKVYAQRGFDLVLVARRKDRLDSLKEVCLEIDSEANILISCCDVTEHKTLLRVFEDAVNKLGRLDTVIANAGFGVSGSVEKLSLEDYQRQFDLNVFAAIDTVKLSLPLLKKNRGKIGIIGSAVSYFSLPLTSPYGMSKAAIKAFAESLYHELRPEGISITLICPGLIKTEIRKVNNKGHYQKDATDPAPFFLQMSAEQAASQIFKAIEKRKREKIITLHGKALVLLYRFFPSFFHFLIRKTYKKQP